MRTHRQIIKDAGGVTKLQREFRATKGTVQSWQQRGAIPAKHWPKFVSRRYATLEELMAGVRVAPETPEPAAILWTFNAQTGDLSISVPAGASRETWRTAMDGMHRMYRLQNPDPR